MSLRSHTIEKFKNPELLTSSDERPGNYVSFVRLTRKTLAHYLPDLALPHYVVQPRQDKDVAMLLAVQPEVIGQSSSPGAAAKKIKLF